MWKLFKQLGLHAKALKIAVKHHEEKQNKETEKIVVEILAENRTFTRRNPSCRN